MKTNQAPMTAAEALKQSKSGKITDARHNNIIRFNEDMKVWEYFDEPYWNISVASNGYFIDKNFLPYDPEPLDQELLDAQKRFTVGSWFTSEVTVDNLYKVQSLIRLEDKYKTIMIEDTSGDHHELRFCIPSPLWISEPRCVMEDPPKETGYYLVVGVRGESQINLVAKYCEGWCYDEHRGDRYYALPKQGGE